MRMIYRHFFNVGDRINCVSKARRTMWESRGIRHDLGSCDRQRVREHFSFALLRRKYESLLEEAARRRRARHAMGIRRKAGFLAAAGLLDYALQLGLPVILVRHLTTQEFGDRKLISKAYLLLAPCGGQGRHLPKGANPRFIVTSLAREAVAAQELYETI